MPYINVLKSVKMGNTAGEIGAALTYLYDGAYYEGVERFRVSIVTNNVSCGHPLEVLDQVTHKMRKKRWWEQQDAIGQMYLPFKLFEPVKVKEIVMVTSGNRVRLSLQLDDEVDDIVDCHFDRNHHCGGRTNSTIRAIQVYRLEDKWVPDVPKTIDVRVDAYSSYLEALGEFRRLFAISPELWGPQQQQQQQQPEQSPPFRDQCLFALRCALDGDGFATSPNGTVYNRASNIIIGYDLQIDEGDDEVTQNYPPTVGIVRREENSIRTFHRRRRKGSVRLASGGFHNFIIGDSTAPVQIETVDDRAFGSGSRCQAQPRNDRDARFASLYGTRVINAESQNADHNESS